MNRLQRNPDKQIVGAEQDRPDRRKRDWHFDLDAGADADLGADPDPAFEAARDLANHFETDSAAGHFVERGAGGHSRAENEFEGVCAERAPRRWPLTLLRARRRRGEPRQRRYRSRRRSR